PRCRPTLERLDERALPGTVLQVGLPLLSDDPVNPGLIRPDHLLTPGLVRLAATDASASPALQAQPAELAALADARPDTPAVPALARDQGPGAFNALLFVQPLRANALP